MSLVGALSVLDSSRLVRAPRVTHHLSEQISGLIKKTEHMIQGTFVWVFDSRTNKLSQSVSKSDWSLLDIRSKFLKYHKIKFNERKGCYTSKYSIFTPGMIYQSCKSWLLDHGPSCRPPLFISSFKHHPLLHNNSCMFLLCQDQPRPYQTGHPDGHRGLLLERRREESTESTLSVFHSPPLGLVLSGTRELKSKGNWTGIGWAASMQPVLLSIIIKLEIFVFPNI